MISVTIDLTRALTSLRSLNKCAVIDPVNPTGIINLSQCMHIAVKLIDVLERLRIVIVNSSLLLL